MKLSHFLLWIFFDLFYWSENSTDEKSSIMLRAASDSLTSPSLVRPFFQKIGCAISVVDWFSTLQVWLFCWFVTIQLIDFRTSTTCEDPLTIFFFTSTSASIFGDRIREKECCFQASWFQCYRYSMNFINPPYNFFGGVGRGGGGSCFLE